MKIHPFAAIRPNMKDAASVASVPYDVVDTKEAKALADGNPKSFLHVSTTSYGTDATEAASLTFGLTAAKGWMFIVFRNRC